MNIMRPIKRLTALLIWLSCAVIAQEAGVTGDTDDYASDANNPLADITAFNIQNYYIPSLSELDDQNADSFWLRYAKPLGKSWLFRASLPVSRVPTGAGETTSGLGDLNLNLWWKTTLKSGAMFGVGPTITAPTASEDETGTNKWQGGLSLLTFNTTSPRFQWGGLISWQTDFAGDDDAPDAESVVAQPIYYVQLGKGLYTGGAPIWVYNVETSDYHVPVGLRLGKVLPGPKVVYNVFVEPQWTILDRGPGQPEFQLYAAVNLQFK
ncbi:MAG: hypothetical protein QNK37_32940 [Acidobacteriota bacterium]|nr:hypothetical protein [Acidobacteriota bacterium]